MEGSVTVVTGLLGGGKSYHTAIEGFEHLMRGGWLYTNVEMYTDKIRELMAKRGKVFDESRFHQLSGESVKGFEEQIKRGTPDMPVMVVLDEAHLEWNSRDYQQTRKDPAQKKMLTLNTLARKLDLAIYYVTQSFSDVDKQIRGKASKLITCRNIAKVRYMGLFRIPFKLFLVNYYDFSESHGKPIKTDWDLRLLNKDYAGIYNSDALLGHDAREFAKMEIAQVSPLEDLPAKRDPKWFRTAQYLTAAISCITFFV